MLPIPILMKAGGFLGKNWKAVAAVAVVAACYFYLNGLNNQIDDWRTKAENAEKAFNELEVVCKENEKVLKDSIAEQNTAVGILNTKLGVANQSLADIQNKQSIKQDQNKQELNELSKLEVGETCDAAMDFLVDEAGKLKWSK